MTARLLILAITASVLFAMWCEPKHASAVVQTDYCQQVGHKVLATDQYGGKHIIWIEGWGLCSDMDRYEQI